MFNFNFTIRLDSALMQLATRLVKAIEADRITPEDADRIRSVRIAARSLADRLKAADAKTP